MPAFTFEISFENATPPDVERFDLTAMSLYFWQASHSMDTAHAGEHRTITRKAFGAVSISESDVFGVCKRRSAHVSLRFRCFSLYACSALAA